MVTDATTLNYNSAAYHEAGHLTAAVVLAMPLQQRGLYIDMEGNGISYYWMRDPGDMANNSPKDQRERQLSLVTLYAGGIAQRAFFPDCPNTGWKRDEEKIEQLLREIHPASEVDRSVASADLRTRAETLVSKYYPFISGLAEELLSRACKVLPPSETNSMPPWTTGTLGRSMTGDEVIEFFKKSIPEASARVFVWAGKNYDPSADKPLYDCIALNT